MTQLIIDAQLIAQFNLATHLVEQSEDIAEYEIDSIPDEFGELYRVWGGSKGINLLGTFYQNLIGEWISQPCSTTKRGRWKSDTEAISDILSA